MVGSRHVPSLAFTFSRTLRYRYTSCACPFMPFGTYGSWSTRFFSTPKLGVPNPVTGSHPAVACITPG